MSVESSFALWVEDSNSRMIIERSANTQQASPTGRRRGRDNAAGTRNRVREWKQQPCCNEKVGSLPLSPLGIFPFHILILPLQHIFTSLLCSLLTYHYNHFQLRCRLQAKKFRLLRVITFFYFYYIIKQSINYNVPKCLFINPSLWWIDKHLGIASVSVIDPCGFFL